MAAGYEPCPGSGRPARDIKYKRLPGALPGYAGTVIADTGTCSHCGRQGCGLTLANDIKRHKEVVPHMPASYKPVEVVSESPPVAVVSSAEIARSHSIEPAYYIRRTGSEETVSQWRERERAQVRIASAVRAMDRLREEAGIDGEYLCRRCKDSRTIWGGTQLVRCPDCKDKYK